jgi:hypothetical protein
MNLRQPNKNLRYEAQPRLDTLSGTKLFDTRRAAVRYLKQHTGYYLLEDADWVMIGKLRVVRV